MKTVFYKCNLCREQLEPNEFTCMFWNSTTKVSENQFGAWEFSTDLSKSDNHICEDCIKRVRYFSEKRQLINTTKQL